MKNGILSLLFVTNFLAFKTYASPIWKSDTAYTHKKGTLETWVFQPFSYALTDDFEVEFEPVLFWIRPSAGFKKLIFKSKKIVFSAGYKLSYDTWLLKLAAKEGTGGIIPHDVEIPQIISGKGYFVSTFKLTNGFFLSLTAENTLSFSGKSNIPSIDYPLLYPRIASYVTGYSFRFGMDLSGKISKHLEYCVDIDVFVMPEYETLTNYEHKAAILWKISKTKAFTAGYKFVYGSYPFGASRDIFPFVDFMWIFNL